MWGVPITDCLLWKFLCPLFPLWDLGSSRRLHAPFPVHHLLDKLMYDDWVHPHKQFSPPKQFSLLYPKEEGFTKKWGVPAIDAAISCANKNLTCPIDNAEGLKNPSDKKL